MGLCAPLILSFSMRSVSYETKISEYFSPEVLGVYALDFKGEPRQLSQ
jgi:hypothetical protein